MAVFKVNPRVSKTPKVKASRVVRAAGIPPSAIGPVLVKGKVRGHAELIELWYDADSFTFYFDDGRLAFSVAPTPYTTPPKSARAVRRDELTKGIEAQRLAIAAISQKQQTGYTLTREEQRTISEIEANIADLDKERKTLRTSTEKMDEVRLSAPNLGPGEKLPPTPGKGPIPLFMERDPQEGKIRFYTRGLLSAAMHGTVEAAATLRLKRILGHLTPQTKQDGGGAGYLAVSQWDFAKAAEALAKEGGFRLMGAPDIDLIADLHSIDVAAKKIAKKSIEFGTRPPKVGMDTQTGETVDFQADGVRFLMSRRSCVLADDMGLGKTYQAIVAAHNVVPKDKQILVVCPAAVAVNWGNDIADFMPSAPFVLLSSGWLGKNGPLSTRPEKVRFVIVSYQAAATLTGSASVAKLLLERDWGCVILDEAHRLKKAEALGHKVIQKYKTDRLWMLTGTPIANRIIDAFGLLKLGQHPLGKSKEAFEKAYGDKFNDLTANTKPLNELGKHLTGFVLRRTKARILARLLPEKVGGIGQTQAVVTVGIPPALAKDLHDYASASGKMNKERMRHALAVAKVPATWDVAERVLDGGGKCVLFTTYDDVMNSFVELCDERKALVVEVRGGLSPVAKSACVKMFQELPLSSDEVKWVKTTYGNWLLNLLGRKPLAEWSAEDRKDAELRFGKDAHKWPRKIDVFVGQMVAASEGVTLTRADTLIFNDLDWMPSRHEQAEDRIYRLTKGGKPDHAQVFIIYMLADHPMDSNVWESLLVKKEQIDQVYRKIDPDADAASHKLRAHLIEDLRGVQEARAIGRKHKWRGTLGL